MNWFKIKIRATFLGLEPEFVYGSSEENLESLETTAMNWGFIHLENPLYVKGNEYKKWAECEKPLVSIYGKNIEYIIPFDGDPSLPIKVEPVRNVLKDRPIDPYW